MQTQEILNKLNTQISKIAESDIPEDKSGGYYGIICQNNTEAVLSVLLYYFQDFKYISSTVNSSKSKANIILMHISGLRLRVDLDFNNSIDSLIEENVIDDIELIRKCAKLIDRINNELGTRLVLNCFAETIYMFSAYNGLFGKPLIELDYSLDIQEVCKYLRMAEKVAEYLLPSEEPDFKATIYSATEIAYNNQQYIEFNYGEGMLDVSVIIDTATKKGVEYNIAEAIKSKASFFS